jgi:hypothetical protein
VWLIPSQLSSDYVLASGCLKLPCVSSSPGLGLHVSLSGKVTPQPFNWRGWKTRAWSQRLFGAATLETSTQDRFLEWWTCSLRGCHASPTPKPGNESETPITGVSGQTAKADPSRKPSASYPSVAPPWCSSRTSQPGFAVDGFEISGTLYQEWVTRSLTRSLSLRAMLARATNGNGCSSWQSPRSNESVGSGYQNQRDGSKRLTLTGEAQTWPTPKAGRALWEEAQSWEQRPKQEAPPSENVDPQRNPASLTDASDKSLWKTPHGMSGVDASGHVAGPGGEFAKQVHNWQTPATDSFRSRGGDRKDEQGIDQQARLWQTPHCPPAHGSNNDETSYLARQVRKLSLQGPPTPSGKPSLPKHRGSRPRLNPEFVTWLMGIPFMWTHPEPINSGALAMQSFLSALRSRLWSFYEGRV